MKKTMIKLIALLTVMVSHTTLAALISGPNIVTVGGQEWAQPDLFVSNSWDMINSQCPVGVCSSGSTINGWDMAGWTWASIYDVQNLFNHYTGRSDVAPFSIGLPLPTSAGTFFEAFRPTEGACIDGECLLYGITRTPNAHPDRADLGVVRHEDPTYPYSSFFDTTYYENKNGYGANIGGFFVRDTDNVPAVPTPATLSLFGLALASMWITRRKRVAKS